MKKIMANYSPFSYQNFCGKILKKIVLEQLGEHLNTMLMLNHHESAYNKNHLTESALVKFFIVICTAVYKKETYSSDVTQLLHYIEFINYDIIIDHLCRYFNTSFVALIWFTSYLTDRHQSVQVGGASSVVVAVTHIVPKGSVLSPIDLQCVLLLLATSLQITVHCYISDSQLYESCNFYNVYCCSFWQLYRKS